MTVAKFQNVSAFILAGGASSRMGCDKALLEINGEPLLLRTVRLVEQVAVPATVIAPPERYASLGLRVVPDDQPGLGPLGGIATALRISTRAWSLIIGSDMPYLTAAWLEFLVARALAASCDALLPESDRGPEPLCAMYHARCAPVVVAAVARGVRKVTDGLAGLLVEKLPRKEWKQFDSRGKLFKNMNSPEDFVEARADFEGMR